MNKALIPIPILWLVLLIAGSPAAASIPDSEPAALKPGSEQRYASRLATRFMTGYHYQRKELDNEFSDRIFEQYLRVLDPNRIYFHAGDIADLERYRLHLDDALKSADLEPAYDIFNLYRRRVSERIAHARGLLEDGFDFTVDEEYRFDRSELPWAADKSELDEIWRKRIKNDWLRLRLTDRSDDEIRTTLERRYKGFDTRVREFNSDDVFQFFMNAFARSIEPHSAYMSTRASENFEISMRLSLEGIGALLQREESEYTTILRIVPGGPADLDGRLKPGDRIIGVGQEDEEEIVDVIGWRLDDVVELIRGPSDTRVSLEVLPAEAGLGGPPKIIELVRNEVQLEEQAAKANRIEVPFNGETFRIGVIRVPVFYVDFQGRARNVPNYRSSTRDVRRLIQELKSEGIDGLVIDLRNNGGGALVEATTMTGLFIDGGPVVQVRDARGRISVEEDREPGMAWDGPLAVLVDRGSASASEIFAAAIQDYGRGVVLGEPTFGKGTVQNLIDLDDFSSSDNPRLGQIRLTMAEFFRIAGGSTQARGVEPDIRLPSSGDPDEYGESALDFALPWSEIKPAEFTPVSDLSTLIPPAERRHMQRREEDDELVELIEELAEWDRIRDRNSVSLLESVRREEMEAAEARRSARFRLSGHPLDVDVGDETEPADNGEAENAGEEVEDVLLRESAQILADLIDLDRDRRLLAHTSLDKDPGID